MTLSARVIAQLRKALGDDAKVARYIETVPTIGYRFVAEYTPPLFRDFECQQHIPRQSAGVGVAGVYVEHAVGDGGAGTAERPATRGNLVDGGNSRFVSKSQIISPLVMR